MAKRRPSRRKAESVSRRRGFAAALLIAVLTLLAYSPSLRGGFILDDNWYLTDAPLIRAADGLYKIWFTAEPVDYYPVSNSTLWVEWRLWGMNPAGYRATNLLLHLVAVGLIWATLRRLAIPGAFLAALLFALHPVNVESVAWIAQRKGVLALVFFLLSLYAFARTADPADAGRPAPHGRRWYALSLAAFVLAVLSKASVAILPLIVLLLIAWRRPLTWSDLRRVVPFFLVSAVLVPVNAWFQTRVTSSTALIGGPLERLLTAGGVVWFYLSKALLPVHQGFVYPKWQVRTDRLWWWLPLTAAALVTLALWRGRRGWPRSLLFAWGYFCIALIPVMGFVDVGFMRHSLVADHYQHVALIGVVALVAAGWEHWHARAQGGWRVLARAVAVVVVALLALLTWRQCGLYRDAETLYRATLAANADSWLAHNNLGFILLARGRPQEAFEHLSQAARLNPDDFDVQTSLGLALFQLGRLQDSIAHYRRALALRPAVPQAHYNLATALAKDQRLDEAVDQYERALALRPDDADTHNNLGGALMELGRLDEAREHFQRAVALDPELAQAHLNLGRIALRTGAAREAIPSLQRAARLDATSSAAQNDLGVALVTIGEVRDGIEHFRIALQLDPNNADARANLGESLAVVQPSESER